jgi:hypothetical protein
VKESFGRMVKLWVKYRGGSRPGTWRWIVPLSWTPKGRGRNFYVMALDHQRKFAIAGKVYVVKRITGLRFLVPTN